MKNENIDDITCKIGPLFEHKESEIPMYSYDRPAYLFWNGVAKGLKKSGATNKEIQWWLQSKCARWMLDGMGEEVEKFGEKCGKEQDIKYMKKLMRGK